MQRGSDTREIAGDTVRGENVNDHEFLSRMLDEAGQLHVELVDFRDLMEWGVHNATEPALRQLAKAQQGGAGILIALTEYAIETGEHLAQRGDA